MKKLTATILAAAILGASVMAGCSCTPGKPANTAGSSSSAYSYSKTWSALSQAETTMSKQEQSNFQAAAQGYEALRLTPVSFVATHKSRGDIYLCLGSQPGSDVPGAWCFVSIKDGKVDAVKDIDVRDVKVRKYSAGADADYAAHEASTPATLDTKLEEALHSALKAQGKKDCTPLAILADHVIKNGTNFLILAQSETDGKLTNRVITLFTDNGEEAVLLDDRELDLIQYF